MKGYLRQDGRKGIRNTIVVAYLVECAHFVAQSIVKNINHEDVHLIGFSGCYPNEYSLRMMQKLCTHPNVAGALLISLGCEGFNREQLEKTILESGRPAKTLVIQQTGGTKSSIDAGVSLVKSLLEITQKQPTVSMNINEIVIGTICGGSDGTSGITANPAVGECFDKLVALGATCIFEETGELIGCEQIMVQRAATPEIASSIIKCIEKAEQYYTQMGYGSFAPGNAEGGLTTLEEKSMGAYAKSGSSRIQGIIKPGDIPSSNGLYLLDVVPDGPPKFGFPNIADNAEIVELIASGAVAILFTTGRGSVVGSAISPVIKICANPITYNNLREDMDIDAGKVINGNASIVDIGNEIFDTIISVASGQQTKSEAMGHREFLLTYKSFERSGPPCLH